MLNSCLFAHKSLWVAGIILQAQAETLFADSSRVLPSYATILACDETIVYLLLNNIANADQGSLHFAPI